MIWWLVWLRVNVDRGAEIWGRGGDLERGGLISMRQVRKSSRHDSFGGVRLGEQLGYVRSGLF
jgi:hypothetical protein